MRTSSSAWRTPSPIVAGTLASQRRMRARRVGSVRTSTRRSRSWGTSVIASASAIATAANAAGAIVTAHGASPGKSPVRSPTPSMSIAIMNTA